MSEASARKHATSLPLTGVVRHRLLSTKHSVVAEAVQKSESWVQKVEEGTCGVLATDIEPFLRSLGLKVVPDIMGVADPEVFNAYKAIATAALVDPNLLTMKDDSG